MSFLRPVHALNAVFATLVCAAPSLAQTATSAHASASELFGRERKGGEVWIVAPSGGDFAQISAAVAAAADGDTLLVKSGTYTGFTIDGKGLNVVEDTGATVQFNGATIQNLAAHQTVVLGGIKSTFTLMLQNDQGGVRIESCELRGPPALSIADCADVVISRCDVLGSDGPNSDEDAYPGSHAIHVTSSSIVTVYETIATGGRGGMWWGGPWSGKGGDGLRQSAGFLFASGSRFKGGRGGEAADDCGFANGGGGGNGIVAPADSHGLDNVFSAGAGGASCGQGHSGPPGQNGTVAELLVGPAQLTQLQNPVRDQSSVPVTFEGAPGSMVFLVVAHRRNHDYQPGLHGVLLAQAPYFAILEMGTIPASGVLSSTLFVPDSWAPDFSATRFFTQAVFQSSGGAVTLSNPTSLVVLDHVF
jgi:hypothetical protein